MGCDWRPQDRWSVCIFTPSEVMPPKYQCSQCFSNFNMNAGQLGNLLTADSDSVSLWIGLKFCISRTQWSRDTQLVVWLLLVSILCVCLLLDLKKPKSTLAKKRCNNIHSLLHKDLMWFFSPGDSLFSSWTGTPRGLVWLLNKVRHGG